MPAVYDPKHGPEPDAPHVLYCQTHGWFVVPEDDEAASGLFAEHQHRSTTHLAYIGYGYVRCEVCGRLDVPDDVEAQDVVDAHNAQYSVA